MTFTLEMLAADYGDGLWIEYGRGKARHRLLIDGGPEHTTTLLDRIKDEIGTSKRRFRIELLVITHIDDDHIGGVLNLLSSLPSNVEFGDIWFNAYKHLPKPPKKRCDRLGAPQAERVSGLLNKYKLPWNMAWGKKRGVGAVIVPPKPALLPRKRLKGGLYLTLLSPTREKLMALRPVWKTECENANLVPGGGGRQRRRDRMGRGDIWPPKVRTLADKRPKKDPSKANGGSIAFLAEYGDRALLLAADAHFDVLESSVERLRKERKNVARLPVNTFKLAHHGSAKNLSNEVLRQLTCSQYLVSTSGKQFAHPDFEALSRIVIHGGKNPQMVFNYENKYTEKWGKRTLRNVPKFRTRYPKTGTSGVLMKYGS